MLIPKNSKDAKGARDFFTTLRTQACSLATTFGDPLKNLADELTKKLDAVIATLPAGDPPGDWSLENQLSNLFSCMAQCSAITSIAGLEVSKLNNEVSKQMASLVTAEIEKQITAGTLFKKESLDGLVEGAIKPRLDSGELVPKTTVTQLCSASRAEGVTEGEKKVRDSISAAEATKKLIDTRRGALQTASFPIPDAEFEAILGGTDDEFAKAKTVAEGRIEALKKAGISHNSELLPAIWLPESEFKRFEKTVATIPALKIKGEPFASPGVGAGTAPPVLAAV